MGIDPNPIGNHKLNTTSIATLAQDLSKILDAEVTYGYQGYEEPYDDVVLGIVGAGKSKQVRLLENDYLHKERGEAGDEEGLQYECSGFNDGYGCNTWINIYKDCFDPPYYFAGRWYFYQRIFIGECDDWAHMFAYRRKIFEEIQLFGGDAVLIHADSSSPNVLEDDPYIIPFNRIVENVKTHPGFLDVSVWLRDDAAPFMENPLIFFDDFSYWPSPEQMIERALRAGKLKG